MNKIYPYAKAIYELFENQPEELNNIILVLHNLHQAAQREDLLEKLLQEPLTNSKIKINLINKLAPELLQNETFVKLINLLANKKKLHYILELGLGLQTIIDEKNNINQIEIISAQNLSEPELQNIKISLEKSLKQKIFLKASVDQDLIAGLIVKTDDYILDNSVKGRLQKMQQKLLTAH